MWLPEEGATEINGDCHLRPRVQYYEVTQFTDGGYVFNHLKCDKERTLRVGLGSQCPTEMRAVLSKGVEQLKGLGDAWVSYHGSLQNELFPFAVNANGNFVLRFGKNTQK